MSDKLDEVINETDPAKRAARVAEARSMLDRYESFLSSEPLIAALDANPLMPMAIAKTMSGVLKALSASVR